jgi:hypothetical protein
MFRVESVEFQAFNNGKIEGWMDPCPRRQEAHAVLYVSGYNDDARAYMEHRKDKSS